MNNSVVTLVRNDVWDRVKRRLWDASTDEASEHVSTKVQAMVWFQVQREDVAIRVWDDVWRKVDIQMREQIALITKE